MSVSYKKLWKLLIDKDMKKKDLCEKAGISPASVTKMGRNGQDVYKRQDKYAVAVHHAFLTGNGVPQADTGQPVPGKQRGNDAVPTEFHVFGLCQRLVIDLGCLLYTSRCV